MVSRSSPRAAASLAWLGSFFALAAAHPAAAQLGHVVKHQKISATAGGFSATLEEMDQFGRSIVNLGDMDGDGVTDLLVGAHTDDDGGIDQGSVYVLFLHANGFVKAWQKISDLEGNFAGRLERGDQFGRAAANLGDLDGDGVVDIAVSANYDDDGGTNKGAVYILFLNADGTVKSSQKISSTEGGLPASLSIHDEFGRSITCLGDLDLDGVVDLLVGTPQDDEGGTNTGALHVLFLNPDGTVKDYERISKSTAGLTIKPTDWFGFCSANIGDFDGDGVVDVVVGAVLDDDGGMNQGSLWILFLNRDGSVKAKREIDELEGGLVAVMDDIDQFGTSVANIGDLDGDGVTDLAVGAVKDDDGVEGNPDADVGAVYVLFMNADASVRTTVKLSDLYGDVPFALDQWDWFGSALAPLGGAPNDGLFNVAIGCRNDDDAGGNMGAIYLVQLNDGTFPAAAFSAGKTLGAVPLTVSFTDESQGDVTAWLWNFGDGGQVSNLQHPTKTYTAPGTYDVQLIARGPEGNDSEIKRDFVTVVGGPLAAFEATPRSGGCPLSVSFTDLSEGGATSWLWDFGDGTTSTEPEPTHVYGCGTFTVTLTVTGPSGADTRSEPDFVVAALQPPVAGFTVAPTTGSAPLDVQFGDASSGQVTSWLWDFGDGQGSTEASPQHRYDAPGSYTVSLNVGGPGGSDGETRSGAVTVTEPPPIAYFEAEPTNGPLPLSVAFSDLTSGAVTAWAWDFGDGASATGPAPVHVYADPGVYSVTLTATGPGGSHARTRPDLVTVEAVPPVPAFTASPTAGAAPLAVQFTDQTTFHPTSWAWDFGDGTTSTARHPAHVYALPGVYTVTLAVSGPGGSDALARADLIAVAAALTTASFTGQPVDGTAPLSVSFLDESSPNVTSWSWSFGDGASSSLRSPTHVYSVPGRYDVSLTVASPTGTDASTRPGYVVVREPSPVAQFAAWPASGLPPLAVQFDDQSTGAVTLWSWSFGDGTTSSAAEPQHVYTVPGTYTVALTVTGPGGASTLTRPGAVQVLEPAPVAAFTGAPTTGTAPLAVQFTDQSTGNVAARSWTFGDGATSTATNPSHVYETSGTYTVTLVVIGPGGTDGETKTAFVTVNEPPVAQFGASPTTGVAPLAVQFTDQSTGNVATRSWSFGDGTTSGATNPAHVYAAPGTYTVALTVSGPGGTDVESKASWITVQHPAPVAAFSAAPNQGVAPLAVQFTDASTGTVTGWAWSFGDGGTSSARSPAHAYTVPGNYTVTLTARGPGGTDEERKTDLVTAIDPVPAAAFTASPGTGTAPLAVQFTDTSTGWVTAWNWDFGDGGTSSARSPAHVYAVSGAYAVTLTASSPGGVDVEARPDCVRVSALPPVAEFGATPREGYAPLSVVFTDSSSGEVTARIWDFGDGTTSDVVSPVHAFVLPASYVVTLTLTGPGGTSSRRRTIVVRPMPIFGDGSFELQSPGLPPGAPWMVFNGTSVLVRAATAPDRGFPRDGARWCDIGAEGTSNARPPTNPGGPGGSPTGTAGIQQDFRFPVDAPHLVFDAAFLLNGTRESTGRNDFMSVDVTDGVTIWNLFHADSFSPFPLVSEKHGLPMTEPVRVRVDLRALFPDAGEHTVLMLRAAVGNVGGAPFPSRGYVDGFRFVPLATATHRNGSGANPSIFDASPAVLGGTWGLEIDPTGRPSANLAIVVGRAHALGGQRLDGGELLIRGPKLFTLLFPLAGGVERFEVAIPDDPALLGLELSAQAALLGGGIVRGNAYDLRLGY